MSKTKAPLRVVVERERWMFGARREVLSCGHRFLAYRSKLVKRRYCDECKQETR